MRNVDTCVFSSAFVTKKNMYGGLCADFIQFWNPRMTDDCHYQVLVFWSVRHLQNRKGHIDARETELNFRFRSRFFSVSLESKKITLKNNEKVDVQYRKLVQSLNKRELGPIWSFLGWS